MKKILFLLGIVTLVYVTVLGVFLARNHPTYLEYATINSDRDSYITINNKNEALVQDFVMPYDVIHGISVQINTFARSNNSGWNVALTDSDNKVLYYYTHFDASQIPDNSYFYIEFNHNIRLTKNGRYQLRISASSVNDGTALAYYVSGKAKDNLSLTFGGRSYDGTLCMKIHGGDSDLWWSGYIVILALIGFLVLLRINYAAARETRWFHDDLVQACFVGIASFLLMSSFCITYQFSDETDNILGGITIANGGVLYRDYVTQHTPFVYYLCSIFALLGAKSVEQFRLGYYLLTAVIWGLLYLRHKRQFGRKMLILPLTECLIVNPMHLDMSRAGCMILSDGVQGLCFVVLLLEFLKFWEDQTIKWDRAIIVSACILCSLGSAFVSAFTLVWFALAFTVIELKKWHAEGISIGKISSRYWKLAVAVVVPLAAAAGYFALNHALGTALDQFYFFNREVYSKYIGGFGNSLFAPFALSYQNLFHALVDWFNVLLHAQASSTIVMQLIILVTALSVIILMAIKRQYLKSALLLAVLCCTGVRGYASFHGLAAWYVAVMIIVLYYDVFSKLAKVVALASAVATLYALSIFSHSIGDNFRYRQPDVSDFDLYVISISEKNEKLIVDSMSFNSLYYLYKNRHIVNRAQYILPWYMDWYEQWLVEDLSNNRPGHVIFNKDVEPWGIKNFTNEFLKALNKDYTRLSVDPADEWGNHIWKRNNPK